MSQERDLRTYETLVAEMIHTLKQAIGVYALSIILQRSLETTLVQHKEAALIELCDDRVVFDHLAVVDPQKARSVVGAFLMEIVATLGSLVGRQLAGSLLHRLNLEKVIEP